jgi:hypothetical protein
LPAIQIDDWGNLEAEVTALSADPERLADLHRKSWASWNERLSERAVAQVIAKCLQATSGTKKWATAGQFQMYQTAAS